MSLTRVRKSSLVQAIEEQIETAIVGGDYKPGDKLPSLQKLQKIVGASHGTLREALRILEQKGLIEIRVGIKGGAFVRESSTESITEGLGLLIRQRTISYKDIAGFRKVVEQGLIKLVIQSITKDEIDILKQNLLQMQTAASKGANGWKEYLNVEVNIRKLLIKIGKNKMYDFVLTPIHENIFSYSHELLLNDEYLPKDAYNDWSLIIRAIAEKDTEKAADLTVQHIERYEDVIADYKAILKPT